MAHYNDMVKTRAPNKLVSNALDKSVINLYDDTGKYVITVIGMHNMHRAVSLGVISYPFRMEFADAKR